MTKFLLLGLLFVSQSATLKKIKDDYDKGGPATPDIRTAANQFLLLEIPFTGNKTGMKEDKHLKTLKVSIKLLWPHIVILFLLVVGIIVSLVGFTEIRKQTETLRNGTFIVKSAVDTVDETFEAMQMSVFRAILNDSQGIVSQAITDTGNATESIQEQLALIRQNTLGDPATVLSLEKYLAELTPMQEYVLDLAARSKNAEAAAYMESSALPVIKEAQRELEQLIQSANAREAELLVSLRQTRRTTIILLISLGVIGVLFSIGVGIYFWRIQN